MDMEQLQYGGTCDKNIDDDDIIYHGQDGIDR